MAKLQDLKYDGVHVFTPEYREFLDEGTSRWAKSLVGAAEKLTMSELEYLWMDAIGSFECSHPDYESPSNEIVERAGPLAWFFHGYGLACCDM